MRSSFASFFLLLSILAGVLHSCKPPDCDHPDCGTCGNACCMMEFKFAVSADEVYSTVVSNLKAGGADKMYGYVNSSDMRSHKLPGGIQYTVQAEHRNSSQKLNDTLNMVFVSNSSNSCLLKGFSITQDANAYCDDGQNYKNLVGFVKGLAQLYAQKVLFGCKGAKD